MTYREIHANNWTTVLDFDFTVQTTQTISTDGSITIGGVVFTKVNSVNDATPMQITNGTGLVIVPNSGGDYYGTTRSIPGLTVNFSNLIPGFAVDTPVRVWAYCTVNNSAQNYDSFTVAIENPISSTNYTLKSGWDGGLGQYLSGTYNGGNIAQNALGTNFSDNVEVITCELGVCANKAIYWSGTYAGGWPSVSALNVLGTVNYGGNIQPSNNISGPASNWDFFIGAGRAGSGTALSITVAKIKVEYQSSLPINPTSYAPLTLLKNAAYTVASGDGNILANLTSAAFTLTLPLLPIFGETHTFKDMNGLAATNNLTISGNGKSIEQFGGTTPPASTLVLSHNYDSVTLQYNGTFWNII